MKSRDAAIVRRHLAMWLCCALGVLPVLAAHAECLCHEQPRPQTEPLELVVVLDATGSMERVHDAMKTRLDRLIVVLSRHVRHLRVGAVVYRTREARFGDEAGVDLTENTSAVREYLAQASALGGGREAIDSGLTVAITRMSWTNSARKVVLLVGDEAEHSSTDEALFALVGKARERGIVLHTVTARRREDLVPLLPATTQARILALDAEIQASFGARDEAALQRALRKQAALARSRELLIAQAYRELPEAQRQGEILDLFARLAELGGGKAVGINREGELVPLMIALALGETPDAEPDSVLGALWEKDEYLDDREFRRRRDSKQRRLVLGQVVTNSDWRVPHLIAERVASLNARYRVELLPQKKAVDLERDPLFELPILMLSGHEGFSLSGIARQRLAEYLRGGGFLFAQACCGSAAFASAFRDLMKELLPEAPLAAIGAEHPLLTAFHDVRQVAQREQAHAGRFQRRLPALELATLEDGVAVVYSPLDLSCAVTVAPGFPQCQTDPKDAARLWENVVLYGLSR